jgi:hypothetical protein
MLIREFDIWQAGVDGGTIFIYEAGTTTLADVFSDPACTTPADNPQTLVLETRNGIECGKFSVSLYAADAYQCFYSSIDQGGVQVPPLTELDGEDVSGAEVTGTGRTEEQTLADVIARTIYATDFGELGSSASTNTATLTAAIGAAAGVGGGDVIIPAGTFPFTQLTLSQGVKLVGQDRRVTTLQSTTGDKVITLNGSGAGIHRLTLDGVSNVSSSIGIYAVGVDEISIFDIQVKNFVTGVHLKGGQRLPFRELYIDGCGRGARFVGDGDAGASGDGEQLSDLQWIGGLVSNCTTSGVEFEYEDQPCVGNNLIGVGFDDNTGVAVKVIGAQILRFDGCHWDGNTHALSVEDDSTSPENEDNVVDGLIISNGRMTGGTIAIEDTALNVMFDRITFSDIDVTLTSPENAILVRDCIEDAQVTITGTGVLWTRVRSIDDGGGFGVTTDAVATKAWEVHLDPGQAIVATALVSGNQQNGTNKAAYILGVSAKRAGATLAYDAQSANFTVGALVTGTTSGCNARIVGDSDSGATGTLTVRSILPGANGFFQDNEPLTDSSGGAATANGTLSVPTVSLNGSSTSLRTDFEDVSAWAAAFVANGQSLEIQVTGAAATSIEWSVKVDKLIG